MERLTGKKVKSLAEAYAQVYAQTESEQLVEYTRFADRPGQPVSKPNKETEAQRLAAAQRQARETVDSRVGRASVNPATGMRYTVEPGNVRRSEGQAAVLGGNKVQWSVDKSGKGSWVPRYDSEGEQARAQLAAQNAPKPAAAAPKPAAAAPKPAAAAPKPAAAAPKPAAAVPSTAAATPAAAAPTKTANPLLKDNSISDMIKASQARQSGTNITSDNIASVRQSVQQANRPEVLNRPAPAGSALAKQQQAQGRTVSGSGAMGSAANPQVRAQLGLKPINPAPAAATPAAKPQAGANTATMNTVGSNLSGSGALAPKPAPVPAAATPRKRTPTQIRQGINAGVDLFDIVKGHLMSEGATEQEAVRLMVIMPQEEVENIVERYGIDTLLKWVPRVKNLINRVRGVSSLPKIDSPIRSRAQDVVRSQRLDVAGTADEFNKLQQAAQQSIDKLKSQTPLLSRRSANLNAKTLESQVRRAASYGPSQTPPAGFTSGNRIDPPKPTGSKPGFVKLDKYGNPIK